MKNLQVLDRWGALVFSKSTINHYDPSEFWDGRVRGKFAASGVYIWQVEIELVDGTTQLLSGEVNLLR